MPATTKDATSLYPASCSARVHHTYTAEDVAAHIEALPYWPETIRPKVGDVVDRPCDGRINLTAAQVETAETIVLPHNGRSYYSIGIQCPSCGRVDRWNISRKAFKGTLTRNACDDVCAHAKGGNCRCSCGGLNHGIVA